MLSGTRVVLLAGQYGGLCAELLASFGAELTVIARPPDFGSLESQLSAADLLIESAPAAWWRAGGLDHAGLAARHPRLICTSISAFGCGGPYDEYRGSELVCSAMGGVLRLVGYPDRAPVKEALDACVFHAEAAAAAGALIALHERESSGLGQHVDVSIQEVACSRLTNAIVLWQFDRQKLARSGDRLSYGRASVRCIWQLQDGYAFHSLMSGRFGAPANAALSRWLDDCGCDNPLREVDWLAYDRSALPAETRARWESALEQFFRARTKREIAGEGRRRGINAAVVQEPSEVLADQQLAARGFLRPDAQGLLAPSYFVRTEQPDHTAASGCSGALAGVKVLDLSWALVGSIATKGLADHGAQVVKLESSQRPCLTRTDVQVARSTRESLDDKPWFAQLNTGKLSLRLDLKHARAWEVLGPLIDWADVVVENFSPGTLHKLGLDYASLQRRRPGLIMISASAYGQTGPLAREWGVDGTSAALSGRVALTGFADRAPVTPGALPYADAVVPQFMVAALLAALHERRRSGAGRYLDVAMYEIAVQQMRRALLAAESGRPLRRAGNRDPSVLLQGVYPARGSDRWIAISLFDAADWSRFTSLLGGAWPDASVLPDAADETLDALDRRIGEYTARHQELELMHRLQAAGIAAGAVQDASDVLEHDPQLRARGTFVPLAHPVLGEFAHQASPYRLSRTAAELRPAPLLGQHDEAVCCGLLGFRTDTYASLRAAGLFR
jgi:crotonobetainyl-CoA:carnitine CoA-transferase CaiB-like acyl-CoA transferase